MQNDKKLVIVGVIGKSAFPDCNKMVALEVLDRHPSLIKHEPKEVGFCWISFFETCIIILLYIGSNTILL